MQTSAYHFAMAYVADTLARRCLYDQPINMNLWAKAMRYIRGGVL